ncbi:MAG: hypothetical protein IJN89_00265 [Anaerotignum sp.]|nr:hypothetical protein [Anaerotignum sp.]
MDQKEKEQRFFMKVKEVCKEPGIAYDFDCPLCGKFAMGFQVPSGDGYIASCNTCHFSEKFETQS